MINEGNSFLKEGNFQRAIEMFLKALELTNLNEKAEEEVYCLLQLGKLYWNEGDLKRFSDFYTRALHSARYLNSINYEAESEIGLKIYSLYKKGKDYRYSNLFEDSVKSFKKAINLAQGINNKDFELKCLRQLSITYNDIHNLKEFFLLNKKALEIAKEINHDREIGKCLTNIGLYHFKSNNFPRALICFQDALLISKQRENKEDESNCLNNIGVIYKEVGNYTKSLDYITKALMIDRQLKNDIFISKDLNNIGSLYRNIAVSSEDHEGFFKALNCFKECLNLTNETRDKRTEINALNNIGNVYLDLNNYNKALHYFHQGYKLATSLQFIEAIPMLQNNLGITYYEFGLYYTAMEFFKLAINQANRINKKDVLWETYFELGKCYEKTENFNNALNCYKEAILIIEDIRSHEFFDTMKIGYIQSKLKVYENLIFLLYKLHSFNPSEDYKVEIYNTIEKAKARALLEMFNESKIDVFERLSPKLKDVERKLSQKISKINYEINNIGLKRNKKLELEKKLIQTEEEYMLLISKIRVDSPEVANLVSPEPYRLFQIQKEFLDERTALVEYFLGDKISLSFLITKDNFYLYPLPPLKKIRKSIKAYLKVLSTPKKGDFRGNLAAKRLYKELFSYLEENMPTQVRNLIIIPDEILFYLPFETLIIPENKQLKEEPYLIKKYKISYAPSASSLLYLSQDANSLQYEKKFLAFGNSYSTFHNREDRQSKNIPFTVLRDYFLNRKLELFYFPSTEKEIKEISKFFPKDKRDVFLNEHATEDILKSINLRNYRIIHFACHGLLDVNFPLRSALILSMKNRKNEDGFLQLREIYNLRLSADLVVLSSCESGIGRLEKGEGIFGLPRIFFYSGAKSVVSTLWRINDAPTVNFMKYFYYHLSRGNDKAQALRLAKLDMLETKYAHPFFWGAFILSGEYSSTIKK